MVRCCPCRHPATPWLPAALALLLLALAGCSPYPRDPEHTTERVASAVMRVGVVHDPPFVRLRGDGDGEPRGAGPGFARALARSLDARVVWVTGGQDELMFDLQEFRLDMVLGGLSTDTPWNKHVALSRLSGTRDVHGRLVPQVLALPPGENRWQLRVERFSRSEAGRAALDGAAFEGAAFDDASLEGAPTR